MLRIAILFCWLSAVGAGEFVSDFARDPAAGGWRAHGDSGLFLWDRTGQQLHTFWDSNRTNSFYYYSLPRYYTRLDDFSASLALHLHSVEYGTTPGKPYTFQIAFGFINTTNQFAPTFYRGSGVNAEHGSRNLVEFTYFPDSGFGATVGPIIATESNQIHYAHTFPLELTIFQTFNLQIRYTGADQTLRTTVQRGTDNYPVASVKLPASSADFVVNAFAISSYSDAGQNPPQFSGSIFAHGTIDDVKITVPSDPQITLRVNRGNPLELMFTAYPGWVHTVVASSDLETWAPVGPGIERGTISTVTIPLATGGQEFYRIESNRKIQR